MDTSSPFLGPAAQKGEHSPRPELYEAQHTHTTKCSHEAEKAKQVHGKSSLPGRVPRAGVLPERALWQEDGGLCHRRWEGGKDGRCEEGCKEQDEGATK